MLERINLKTSPVFPRIFGDTVNTAARLQTTCEAGRVQLSTAAATYLQSPPVPGLSVLPRGEIPIKGKVRAV